ncbi:MAG: DoxX family protein [Planctomycetes bacterium]|nr:DoxX family protein [Planctomycetota bacterium]
MPRHRGRVADVCTTTMNSAPERLKSTFSLLDRFVTPVAQIVTRIAFGQAFALTGWGKLTNLDRTVAFFESLGIPAPSIQAPMVATIEFVGGLLLVFGLGTRVAAALLTCTMLVALMTAHGGDIAAGFRLDKGFDEAAPVPYLVATLWLLAKGPGALAIDALIAKRHGK